MSDETTATLRRLPVYLLLDCSGSMAGEPIAAMDMGLKTLISDLKNDPQALETVWLSVITFASDVQQIMPLTDVEEFVAPELVANGATRLGGALELLTRRMEEEVRTTTPEQKGDWKPLVFILTDGEPNDEWSEPVKSFRSLGRATVIACGAGPEVNDDTLKQLGDKIVRLKDTQPGTLGAFMKWVSATVTTASHVIGTKAGSSQRFAPLPTDEGITVLE